MVYFFKINIIYYDDTCHYCKKLGHFSRVCHSKPIQSHPPLPYISTLQSTQPDSSLSFEGLSGFCRIVDDIAIYDGDVTQHASHVREFLQRCAEKKITLNLDKCKFCESSVTFAGFQLSATGYQVDHTIIDAISKFPTPANHTDLRSFFGLVNQLSASTNTISTLLTLLHPLLSTRNDFQWSATHDQAFQTAKESLTDAPVLSFFDMSKSTRLCTDASRQGLGFIFQQQDNSGTWSLIQTGSQFLTDAESCYAITELEMLDVA